MRTRILEIAALCATSLATSCVLVSRPNGIVVSSDPSGATVLIDRRDSGFVTPCVLEVDADHDKRVDIELKGYMRETRFLTPDHEVYAVLWREMSVGYKSFDFPLFLNFRDFFVPVKYRETVSPGRIHVRLDRRADSVGRADESASAGTP